MGVERTLSNPLNLSVNTVVGKAEMKFFAPRREGRSYFKECFYER